MVKDGNLTQEQANLANARLAFRIYWAQQDSSQANPLSGL